MDTDYGRNVPPRKLSADEWQRYIAIRKTPHDPAIAQSDAPRQCLYRIGWLVPGVGIVVEEYNFGRDSDALAYAAMVELGYGMAHISAPASGGA